MVLRQIGGNPSERAKQVEESVEKAKEAVQMDIQDGTSWCMHLLKPQLYMYKHVYIIVPYFNIWALHYSSSILVCTFILLVVLNYKIDILTLQ